MSHRWRHQRRRPPLLAAVLLAAVLVVVAVLVVAVLVAWIVWMAPWREHGPVPWRTTATETGQVVTVTGVVDGDTLDTTAGRVRVAVVDSCERGSPGGRAATADAHALLDGQTVRLVVVGDRDRERYGRLLREVVLSDGRDFGAAMAARRHTGIYAGHIDAWPDYIGQVRAADIDGRDCG